MTFSWLLSAIRGRPSCRGRQPRLTLRLESLEERRLCATFTVTTTADSGPGSLRQAILDANSRQGGDLIHFAIGSGVRSIAPVAELPFITDPVTLDARTQPGYAGTPVVQLDGYRAGPLANGIVITARTSQVSGLVINRFARSGLVLAGDSNVAVSNYIGTDVSGTIGLGNGSDGVVISGGRNRLGGSQAGEGNLIAANGRAGVRLFGPNAANNQLIGNFLGTNAAGSEALGNAGPGVVLDGTGSNSVGSRTPGQGNVISGNGGPGIQVRAADAASTSLFANLIGLDATGSYALGNGGPGLLLLAGQTFVGSSSGGGNVISGNRGDGVQITAQAGLTVLQSNLIGTDITGTMTAGNGGNGVLVAAPRAQIGSSSGGGNVIGGNDRNGVEIQGPAAREVLVFGNHIGTDVSGALPLANAGHGVRVWSGASNNSIGSTLSGGGNSIAFNGGAGVVVGASPADPSIRNSIRHNTIFGNGGLPIDLADDGPTANDDFDADTGPNGLYNHPVLSAVAAGVRTRVQGIYLGRPYQGLWLDFYADASATGPGGRWIGSFVLATDAEGIAPFDEMLTGATLEGELVSATAWQSGDTSEYADAVVAELPAGQPHRTNWWASRDADLIEVLRRGETHRQRGEWYSTAR